MRFNLAEFLQSLKDVTGEAMVEPLVSPRHMTPPQPSGQKHGTDDGSGIPGGGSSTSDGSSNVTDVLCAGLPTLDPASVMRCYRDGSTFVALSHDGAIAVTMGAGSYRIPVWNLNESPPTRLRSLTSRAVPQVGRAKYHDILEIAPNGKRVAAAFDSCTGIAVWDFETGMETCPPFTEKRGTITSIAMTADGTEMFVSFRPTWGDSSLVQYNTNTGDSVRTWKLSGVPEGCACSGDGKYVACVVRDKQEQIVYVYDGVGGATLRCWSEFSSSALRVFMNMTGTRILIASCGSFRVHDLSTGRLLSSGLGPENPSTVSVAFEEADRGGLVVSMERNRSVVAWDMMEHKPVYRMDGISCLGGRTAVCLDGGVVAAGDIRSRQAFVWRFNSDEGTTIPPDVPRPPPTPTTILPDVPRPPPTPTTILPDVPRPPPTPTTILPDVPRPPPMPTAIPPEVPRSPPMPTAIPPEVPRSPPMPTTPIQDALVDVLSSGDTEKIDIQFLRKIFVDENFKSTLDVIAGHSLVLLVLRTGQLSREQLRGDDHEWDFLMERLYWPSRKVSQSDTDREIVRLVSSHAERSGIIREGHAFLAVAGVDLHMSIESRYRELDRRLVELSQRVGYVDDMASRSVTSLERSLNELYEKLRTQRRRAVYVSIAQAMLALIPVVGSALGSAAYTATQILMNMTQNDMVGAVVDVSENPIGQIGGVDLSNPHVVRYAFSQTSMGRLDDSAQRPIMDAVIGSRFRSVATLDKMLVEFIEASNLDPQGVAQMNAWLRYDAMGTSGGSRATTWAQREETARSLFRFSSGQQKPAKLTVDKAADKLLDVVKSIRYHFIDAAETPFNMAVRAIVEHVDEGSLSVDIDQFVKAFRTLEPRIEADRRLGDEWTDMFIEGAGAPNGVLSRRVALTAIVYLANMSSTSGQNGTVDEQMVEAELDRRGIGERLHLNQFLAIGEDIVFERNTEASTTGEGSMHGPPDPS